jgi:SAM-dependent methyltransferase
MERRKADMKVLLGEQKKRAGYVTIDKIGDSDIIADITIEIPLPTDSVDYLKASHVLEHFDSDSFIRVMKEIYRVCKPDSVIEIIVPYSIHGFCDPTHKMFFIEDTFKRFTRKFWKEYGNDCWYIEDQYFILVKTEILTPLYGTEIRVILNPDKLSSY